MFQCANIQTFSIITDNSQKKAVPEGRQKVKVIAIVKIDFNVNR